MDVTVDGIVTLLIDVLFLNNLSEISVISPLISIVFRLAKLLNNPAGIDVIPLPNVILASLVQPLNASASIVNTESGIIIAESFV